jgi:hypothetical protein
MNLLGRIAGQFLFVAVILFSCKEDTSFLGFKRPQSNFKATYAEIPIAASVMTIDSLNTVNEPPSVTDTKRLLVGRYLDDKMGLINSEVYFQFRPLLPKISIPSDAVVNEIFLTLTYDYYYYGSKDVVSSDFFVHELTDTIFTIEPRSNYNFGSTIKYDPNPIGSTSVLIDVTEKEFDKKFADNNDLTTENDHIDTLKIGLNAGYGQQLLEFAKTSTEADSNYPEFLKFTGVFKGLAIVSSSGNKIFGFDPRNDPGPTNGKKKNFSKLLLIYKYTVDGVEKRGKLEFVIFNGAIGSALGFNRISADRSATPLAGATPFKEFLPSNNLCYVQAGNPIVTKLDFTKFYEYVDTIPNIILNSAELVIDPIEPPTFPPPATLELRVLATSDNKFKRNSNIIPSAYLGSVLYDNDNFVNLVSDTKTSFSMKLTTSEGISRYAGFLTDFTQLLHQTKSEEDRFQSFALVPLSPGFGKSVNRVIFNKNNVKLRIYYTTPVLDK